MASLPLGLGTTGAWLPHFPGRDETPHQIGVVKASPQEPERKGILELLEQGCRNLGGEDPELEDVVAEKDITSPL